MDKSTQKLIEVVSKAAHTHKTETKVFPKKANIAKKATVTLELEMDDYIELLKNEFATSPEDWKHSAVKSLFPKLLEMIEDSYEGSNVQSPSVIVDNYCVNGDFISREDDFTADGAYKNKFEEYNGDWEEFCSNEALIYNDEYACMQF